MLDLQRLDRKALAKALDFSILPKETTEAEIRDGCAVTRRYGFAAFYSSSAYWTPLIRQELAGLEDVEIGTGIAFPFGAAAPAVKAFEVEDAVGRGCTAVDMVLNIGALKTIALNWLQPHEGNIVDFLYRNRAFQNSPPPAH